MAVTFGAQMVGTMVMFAPAVLAPAAQYDIGLPASSVGAMTAICYAGCVATMFLSGRGISRFGPLRWSQISLLFLGGGASLLASGRLAWIVMGGLLMGIGYGGLTPASSVILAKRTPARLRSTIFSLKQTGVPAGGTLAGAVIPSLILWADWQTAILVVGAACLGLALLLQPTRRVFDRPDPGSQPRAGQGIGEALRLMWNDRRLREIVLISFTYGGVQMMFVSFFVVYLTRDAGLTLVQAGGAMAAAMVAGVAGRILWGIVADRRSGPRRLLGWLGLGSSIATVLMALIGTGWSPALIYGVGIAMGLTAVSWNGLYLAEVARIAPRGDVGMATSATLMFTFGGVVIIPPLCSWIVAITGSYTILFLIMAALNLPVALLPLRRRQGIDRSMNQE